MTTTNDLSVRRALENAGVEFIDENGADRAFACTNQPVSVESTSVDALGV